MMDKTLYLMVYDSLPEESKKAISELWDTGINNSGVWVRFGNVEATIGKVIWPFRNYTVDMEVLKQVQLERDIALEQIEKIGKSLGEKMDDIVKVKHGNWVPIDDEPHETFECDRCGNVLETYDGDFEWAKFCPNCGALMDGNDE